jgi:hypothetical protein
MKEIIDIKILNEWRLESYNLSNKFIADNADLSVPTVIEALKNKMASPETFAKLENFFNSRKVKQSQKVA